MLLIPLATVKQSFLSIHGKTTTQESPEIKEDKTRLYRITPEYKRTMKRIVISLAKRDITLNHHHELLVRLPEYTKIILLVPESNFKLIKAELQNRPYRKRVEFVLYNEKQVKDAVFYLLFPEKDKLIQVETKGYHTTYQQGTLWAQDLFEVAMKPDGQIILLISDVYKWFNMQGDKKSLKVVSDNSYLARLITVGMEVRKLPVTFDGGNILVDELNAKRIVICGGNVLRNTRTVWKSTREATPTNSQIITMIKKFMCVDEVIIVGKSIPQPSSLMFHLDQAMIFLENGIVGVTNVVGKYSNTAHKADEIEEVERFLSELRLDLMDLGYKIVNIDTSVRNLVNHQHYVNAIPYIDAETGQRTLLMPIFSSTQTHFEKELVKKNTAIFKSLGYQVVHIPTESYNINGGIHCLVNVLE